MADDIDELLEEVENKFFKSKPSDNLQKSESDVTSLDSILFDIGEYESLNDELFSDQMRNPRTQRKCFPVYLSGTQISKGCTTAGEIRACDKLHCTSCDFSVAVYGNMAWRDGTDYLFLRTNMPDFAKVSTNLKTAEQWQAYACQCCHQSTRELVDLNTLPTIQWICKGHSTKDTKHSSS
ncbi:cilia- and flagella-associated protein 418-like [Schistocerca gregaria]|uniref:cilia- and flagella-associated protein 418-like n=1 Tax=Schistocerca gregaria TaxID=7010 RepID=UPI00211E4301|nr:cilia- and flagella-associated protein 418-like [Schistocerca gregaria]